MAMLEEGEKSRTFTQASVTALVAFVVGILLKERNRERKEGKKREREKEKEQEKENERKRTSSTKGRPHEDEGPSG
jgi:mannitol-specific phosphotransferase system IIBC component